MLFTSTQEFSIDAVIITELTLYRLHNYRSTNLSPTRSHACADEDVNLECLV